MGAPLLVRRPFGRASAIAVLAAVVFGCQPEIVGPEDPEQGPLRIRPVLVTEVDPEALDLDEIDVVIRRAADGAVVREATLAFEPEAILAWVLSLQDLPDLLDIEARVRSGTTPMFEGSLDGVELVEASPASPGAVHEVEVHYVGPGRDAVAVSVQPADPVVTFGATTQFEAVATNAAGDPIPNAILFWASSAPSLAPVDDQGFLTAPDERGAVDVSASTVTGVSGSASVAFQPPAAELIVLEGDGVTASVAGVVTITARVLGSDGLGLQDVEVTFDSPAGASVADASIATAPDGTASAEATVGTLPGVYVFMASAAGLSPVTATIEAEPGPPAALEIDLNGSTATPTEPLTPGVTVLVLDAFGNVTGAAVDVSVALDNNPTGALLSGTTVATSVDGVAEFTDLVLDRHGSGFTLTASSSGLPSVASGPFDVLQAPVSVEVSPAEAQLDALGATAALAAVARDAAAEPIVGQTFVWTSSDESVAVVDAAGVVTAVGNGTAEIDATAGGVSGTATVTVGQVVTSVTVSPSAHVLTALGDQVQLTAEAADASGFPVAGVVFLWVIGDSGVAGVDATGLVTAEANGQTTVTAIADGVSGSATIEVAQEVANVEVTPPTSTLTALADQAQLGASAFDANGNPVGDVTLTWSSEAESVATVDATGLVTAQANGSATITAEAGGVGATAEVTVAQEVATIELSVSCQDGASSAVPTCDTLKAFGDQALVTAEASDANGFAVADPAIVWTSLAPQFAPVDTAGVVTAIDNGTATIRAEADGAVAEVEIVVRQVVVDLVVEPEALTLGVEEQGQLTATALDANAFPVEDAEVTWSSLHEEIATVDETGLVTGVGVGHTHVQAAHDLLIVETSVAVE